jgi:hypothetical protein
VDVFADERRRLDVIDPDGRQLLITVGAAVLNPLGAQVVLLVGYAPPTSPTPAPPVAKVLIPASAGGGAGSVDSRDQ